MATISSHLVVGDPEHAARWYADVPGAPERSRIPLPDGHALTIELQIGGTSVHPAGEFPQGR